MKANLLVEKSVFQRTFPDYINAARIAISQIGSFRSLLKLFIRNLQVGLLTASRCYEAKPNVFHESLPVRPLDLG